MTSERLRAFIDAHMQAWNLHDAGALCAHHSEDGAVSSPMFSRIQGRQAICSSYSTLFSVFPDWRLEFGEPICEGNRVALPFSASATHQGEFMGLAGTGRHFGIEGVSLYQLDEQGLIQDERRIYDFTGLLTKLGVLRLKPAR